MRALPTKWLFIAFFVTALALGQGACAGAASGGASGGASGTPVRRSSSRIDETELATVAETDVFTAINRLRPAWLRPGSRGTLPEILLDGTPQSGGPEVLRNFRAADVSTLEYMSASDATTRYGTGYTAGAIIVTTKR